MTRPKKQPAKPRNVDSAACTWVAERLLKLVHGHDPVRDRGKVYQLALSHADAWVVLRALATHADKPED